MNALIYQIKEKIAEKGLSVSGLEKKAELKPSSIQNILHGRSKNPSITIIKAIATALNCSVDEFINPMNNKKNMEIVSWDKSLYFKTLEKINEIITENNMNIQKHEILSVANEVYDFTINNKETEPDERLAKWLLAKILKT